MGDGASNNGYVAGNVSDAAMLNFADPNAQTYSGLISGSGSLTKSGTGTLVLSGTNTFTGGTLTAGTLQMGNASPGLNHQQPDRFQRRPTRPARLQHRRGGPVWQRADR